MSRRISLTQGKFAIVDDADYEWLNRFKWCAVSVRPNRQPCNYYAGRNFRSISGKRFPIKMHREILGLKRGDKLQCDHIDHNGLNNQRSNLRICTSQQNHFNRKSYYGSSSKFKGVFRIKQWRRWRAHIRFNTKRIHLGYFNNEVEAAKAYNRAAQKLFGEFAKLNEIGD